MDYESERSRKLGCWDAAPGLTSLIDEWATTGSTPDFEPSTGYCDFTIDTGMGKQCPREAREFWTAQIKGNYKVRDFRSGSDYVGNCGVWICGFL